MELSLPGTKVPGSESSTVWNFRSRERKFLGAKVPAFAVCIADSQCLRTRLKKIPVLQVLRHLFLLNKWQYRNKYIIVIVVVSEKIQVNTSKKCKKVPRVVFEPGIASCNGGHAHH